MNLNINVPIVNLPTPLSEFNKIQILELQRALELLGYPVGSQKKKATRIDGLYGKNTEKAWKHYLSDNYAPFTEILFTQDRSLDLRDKVSKLSTGPYAFSELGKIIRSICSECDAHGIGSDAQKAYVLATVKWETNRTYKPVKEAYWLSEDWRKHNLRYYPYYGRGYVQLTWEYNYKYYTNLLGPADYDLVKWPNKVMVPEVSLFVLVHGFKTGAFTGKKITDYINDDKTDFRNARRCINGTDHWKEIKRLAEEHLEYLNEKSKN